MDYHMRLIMARRQGRVMNQKSTKTTTPMSQETKLEKATDAPYAWNTGKMCPSCKQRYIVSNGITERCGAILAGCGWVRFVKNKN